MKICTVIGARPQFIKAAIFSKTLRENTGWNEIMIHTGQHYDENMSAVFFDQLQIPAPKYNLGIQGKSQAQMCGEMMVAIEKILLDEKPDLLLVYGDTTSTLAGALTAKKLHIKVAHIEAGLRSDNLKMPEEINRIVTDKISDFLFCPVPSAVRRLEKEGIGKPHAVIYMVGDIMYDALLQYTSSGKSQKPNTDPYIVLTIHRAENTNEESQLRRLLAVIDLIAANIKVVFPVHPRTRTKLEKWNISSNAQLIEPLSYFEMIDLMKNSEMVITDSGGLQKEAFYLDKFCITLRPETEWQELVDLGVNAVCHADEQLILASFNLFNSKKFPNVKNPYGDGTTSLQIIEALKDTFS